MERSKEDTLSFRLSRFYVHPPSRSAFKSGVHRRPKTRRIEFGKTSSCDKHPGYQTMHLPRNSLKGCCQVLSRRPMTRSRFLRLKVHQILSQRRHYQQRVLSRHRHFLPEAMGSSTTERMKTMTTDRSHRSIHLRRERFYQLHNRR